MIQLIAVWWTAANPTLGRPQKHADLVLWPTLAKHAYLELGFFFSELNGSWATLAPNSL
jgi:hypothetical protein